VNRWINREAEEPLKDGRERCGRAANVECILRLAPRWKPPRLRIVTTIEESRRRAGG
jgi:hypothetical protein